MVYVDSLMGWPSSKRWRYGKACHLFVPFGEPIETLHEFARKLGMRREWFQVSNSGLPHYDLTASRRERAVALGAIEASREFTVSELRKYKTQNGRSS